MGISFYSHSIFGFHICWVKNKRQLVHETYNTKYWPWLRCYLQKRDIPFSWMTLHTWFGRSVKCLLIRSPPEASTSRSQLRHLRVNLRKTNKKKKNEKTKKHFVFNMQNISFHEVYLLQCWWFFLIHFQNSVFGYSTMISNKGQRQIC